VRGKRIWILNKPSAGSLNNLLYICMSSTWMFFSKPYLTLYPVVTKKRQWFVLLWSHEHGCCGLGLPFTRSLYAFRIRWIELLKNTGKDIVFLNLGICCREILWEDLLKEKQVDGYHYWSNKDQGSVMYQNFNCILYIFCPIKRAEFTRVMHQGRAVKLKYLEGWICC